MAYAHLAIYLNDHLAGATTALELIGHMEAAPIGEDRRRFLSELRAEIQADHDELEAIMLRLNIAQSVPRRAAAWLAEKTAHLKLKLDDTAGGALYQFEGLEALSLGIEGKKALWRALATIATDMPILQDVDFALLQLRAEDQRNRVETARLEAARSALSAV